MSVRRGLRLFIIALILIAVTSLVGVAPAAAVSTPFTCNSTFYQASSTAGLFSYNPVTNRFAQVSSGSWTSINGIGYNSADNYIYGFSGTTLYRVDSAGVQTNWGTVSGAIASPGAGDFWPTHGYLDAPTSGNSWSLVTVGATANTSTATAFTLTGSTWGAFDATVVGDMAYGLNNQTLYIVNLSTKVVTTKTVGASMGAGYTAPTNNSYGAAYSDSEGNLYFYGNTDGKVFQIKPTEIAKATPSSTLMGSGPAYNGATGSTLLSSPNDGANCTSSGSAYAPIVTTSSATNLADHSATINGTVSPNNSAITAASFCYGTNSSLSGCTQSTLAPATYAVGNWPITSSNNASTANLTGLTGGTTYYFRMSATNSVGSNSGSILSFTTTGSAFTSQTITFTAPSAVNYGDGAISFATLGATASSSLPVTYSVSGPCSISGSSIVITGAGSCTITASQAGNSTYSAASDVVHTLSINKAALSVTASSHSVTVGDSAPTLAATYGSFAYSDSSASLSGSLSCATTYTNSSVAGTYATTCSGLSSPNYTITFVDGSVVASDAAPVAPTSQTITFTAPSAVNYGDGAISFATLGATASSSLPVTYSVSGPCSISGSSIVITGAGSCTITASQAGNSTYSAASDVVHTLSINKAALSVTASSHSVTVGDSAPTLAATYGSFAYSDSSASLSGSLSCATTYTNSSVAGTYATTCSGLSSPNYTITFVDGSVVASDAAPVAPTSQTITFTAPSAVNYGDGAISFATLGATASSSLPVTYSVSGPCSISGSSIVITGAGSCTITASQAGNSTYSAASDVVHTLSINKAALSVTASSHSVTVGDSAPTLAATYGSFAYSDSSASLSGSLSCATTYTNSSVAGTYATTCSGLSSPNYTITFVDGSVVASDAAPVAPVAPIAPVTPPAPMAPATPVTPPAPVTPPTPVAPPARYNYLVSYDANGGSGTTSTQTGSGLFVTLQNNEFSRGGWSFSSWNTSVDGLGTRYTPGQTIWISTNVSISLFAIWSPGTFLVSYSGNGATGGVQPSSQAHTIGQPSFAVLPCTFVREGYSCSGWNTSPNGTGAPIAAGTQMAPSTNYMLYAQWVQDVIPTPAPVSTPTQNEEVAQTPSQPSSPTLNSPPSQNPAPVVPNSSPAPLLTVAVKAEVKTIVGSKKIVANQIVPVAQVITLDLKKCSGQVSVTLNGNAINAPITSTGQLILNSVLGPNDKVFLNCTNAQGVKSSALIAATIEKINLANVNFDLSSAKLTSAAKAILNKVAKTIIEHGFTQITLTGYTDSQASGGYNNKKLSVQRAASVDAYLSQALRDYGVAIATAGKAAINPLASNKDKVGQAVNRRVEITVA